MVRRAATAGSAKVYDISGRNSTTLTASLAIGARATAAQKRARRKEEHAQRETELLQEFVFPTVSTRVKQSADGQYIFASGTYAPQIHVYDTNHLSLKFKRHVDAEIVDFQILESDWRKFALLSADRFVDVHSPFGSHFRTRVPRVGRDLMLHRGTCDLFVCGAGRDVWRLNLEQGRFLAPLTTQSKGNNVCGICPANRLLAFGGEGGTVEVWDPRVVGRAGAVAAGVVDAGAHLRARGDVPAGTEVEVSAVRFDEVDGHSFAVGTTTGHTLLYDLRASSPTLVRDQGFGLPVHSVRLHRDGTHVVSSDAKSIKVWDRSSGRNAVTIEPDADVNHVCVIGSSGVMCAAVEASRVRAYYVPSLGAAPRWCAFLDSVTEELEDDGRRIATGASGAADAGATEEEVYENYKFVPAGELEGLGLGRLIGTDMLKPYMHGFFVHAALYRRAVDASAPFAYEKYKQERAREKVEKMRESRIGKVKKSERAASKVKVNRKMAEVLESKRTKGKKGAVGAGILEDPRFSAMFEKEEFRVDEEAERFQMLNPMGMAGPRQKEEDGDDSDEEYLEQFALVDNAGTGKANESDGDSSDDSDGDGGDEEGVDEESAEDGQDCIRKVRKDRVPKKKQKGPRMFEIEDAGEVLGQRLRSKSKTRPSREEQKNVALGARLGRGDSKGGK